MAYEEFIEGKCTQMELKMLCKKAQAEITLVTDRVKNGRLVGNELIEACNIELEPEPMLMETEVYDVSLLEAMAGNVSGFAAVAERDIKKNGLKKADGKWNNYIVALQEMGYPCMNSFLYAQCIKAKKKKEAMEYLKKAREKKEYFADFFYGSELLRKGKRLRGLKHIKKIAENKDHPLRHQAKILKHVYRRVSGETLAIQAFILGGGLFGMWCVPYANNLSGIIAVFALGALLVSLVGVPLVINKYRRAKQMKAINFNDAVFTNGDKAFGELLLCPEYPTSELEDSENFYVMDESVYKKAHTDVVTRDVSDVNEAMVMNIKTLAIQLHRERERRKNYYMEKCKTGDSAARVALLVFFDTEYRNGEFVVSKQGNPCRFIPDTMAKIID